MKHLLGKTKSYHTFRVALREWRNTPRFDGLSPAQWLFGRRQRTDTAASPLAYERISDQQFKAHETKRGERIEKRKTHFDQASRPLEQLKLGDEVYIQDSKNLRWDTTGTIVEKRGRSYAVEAEGKTSLRNRRHLRPCQVNRDDRTQTASVRQKRVQFKF